MIDIILHPDVLGVLISVVMFLLAFAGRKTLGYIDSKWANEHLAGIGGHVHVALDAGLRELKAELLAARDPESDGGVKITKTELKTARDAALARALEEIGLAKLRKALGISRGQKVSVDAAKAFVADNLDSAVDQHVPFESA